MNIKTITAKIDKTQAAKKIVRFATGYAVGKTVHNIIRNNVPENDNPVINFAVGAACVVGGTVAAGYVLDALGDYSDAQIDQIKAELAPLFHQTDDSDVVEGTVLQ